MSRGPVKIERYNPSWRIRFEKSKEILEKSLGDLIHEIEHVGSTSIEGLGAKPIIDIAITTQDVDNPDLLTKMKEIGFQYVDKYEDELPFRRYFILTDKDSNHLVHVHIVPISHEFFEDHIVFRDYLANHSDIRDEYHFLKTRLANKFKYDRQGYQNGKSAFIERILNLAKEENFF